MLITKMPKNKGVSLYLTVVILSLMLIFAFGISGLFIYQLKQLQDIGKSVSAFYAAETGIERTLWEISLGNFETACPDSQCQATLANNAVYATTKLDPGNDICPADIANYCLKSIGKYKDVNRGIKIAR